MWNSATTVRYPALLVAFVIQFVAGVIGLFSNCGVFGLVANLCYINRSSKLLILNSLVAAATMSVQIIGRSFYILIFVVIDPKLLEIPLVVCRLMDSVRIIPLLALTITLLLLSFETLLALARFRNISSQGRCPRLTGIGLLVLVWLLAGAMEGVTLLAPIPQNRTLPYCNKILAADNQFLASILAVNAVVELLAVIVCIFSWKMSERYMSSFCINQAQISLTARLRLRRNIDLTTMLLPALLMNASLFFVSLTITIVGMLFEFNDNMETNLLDRMIFTEWSNYTTNAIVMLLHPLVLLKSNQQLMGMVRQLKGWKLKKDSLIELSGRLSECIPMHGGDVDEDENHNNDVNESDVRFQELSNMWDKKLVKQQSKNKHLMHSLI